MLDFYPAIIFTQFGKAVDHRKTNTYPLEYDKQQQQPQQQQTPKRTTKNKKVRQN